MPYFFRYDQEDLTAFCEKACASVDARFLLYNLPSFTNPLEVGTAVQLLNNIPNLIGMKDSSGQKDNLAPLAGARADGGFSLLVGDDSLLLAAARAGWDGVISGIACFAPELVAAVYRSHQNGCIEEASRLQGMLDQIIEWVVRLPIPWAVRVGLAARGIPNGPMHLPPSAERAKQIIGFRDWFRNWAAGQGLALESVWSFGGRPA
jgi:4-hydroxy-tetrahydrodipicolinate synthase